MFIQNNIMEYIEKKNGYVYLVQENSTDGRFKTYYKMGKDPDDERWKEKPKSKKTKKRLRNKS